MSDGSSLIALVFVAAAVGVGNFAAAVGIGVGGASTTIRIQVGVVFGVFEGGMPIVGLLLGHQVAGSLGKSAGPIGGALLGMAGAWSICTEVRQSRAASGSSSGSPAVARSSASSSASEGSFSSAVPGCEAREISTEVEFDRDTSARVSRRLAKLILTGAILGIDNLVVGFALGTYHVNIGEAAVVIGAVSVVLSLLGLELGRLVGGHLGRFGELAGGLVLVGVGVLIGIGVL